MNDSSTAAMSATAVAHANIALIKYWGKANAELILPVTPSLSLTLDALYTTTTVTFDPEQDVSSGTESDSVSDTATLDGEPVTGKSMARISALLDLVRARAGITAAAQVDRKSVV